MRVVIDLDALRRRFQIKRLAHLLQQPRLACRLGKLPAQRLFRIGERLQDQLFLAAARRTTDLDLPVRAQCQSLLDQLGLTGLVRGEDQLWRWPVIIELHQKGGDDLARCRIALMLWIIGFRAPVLTRPVEEDLHAGLSAISCQSEHVCLFHTIRVDVLAGTHRGNGADTVAQARGLLKLQIFGRLFHFFGELLMEAHHLATQKVCRLIGQRLIVLRRDHIDAGRGAALDLILHTRARALLKNRVLTIP